MTTAITSVQPNKVQHASKKKKKPGFLARLKKGFVTSIYVTHFWAWFLGLAGRLVQPVLFFTVMYSMVQTYPGFKSPGAWIDQTAFLLQNGALDIASFGLPKLAEQAMKDGNEEGAEKARQTSKALFWIMISNLVWGGIEHITGSGIPDGVKTGVALIFIIVRAYYAISYTSIMHSLEKAEDEEEEVAPLEVQGVQAESEQVQSLRAEVQALTREVQALVQQANRVEGQGQGGAMSEGQVSLEEVLDQIGEVQDGLIEVQDQVQGQLAEVLAQLARVQEGASMQMLPTVVGVQEGAIPQVQGAIELNAPRQQRGNVRRASANDGVQGASGEGGVQGAMVQGAQSEGASAEDMVQQASSVEVQAESQGQQASDEEGQGVQHNTEPLHLPIDLQVQGGATPPGFRDAIFAYVLQEVQRTGKEPSVNEIRVGVGCGERTVKSYRAAAIAKAREVVSCAG